MSKTNKIEIGKFYIVYGGSPHPSYVFDIDKKHKTIKAIKFGTTKAKHMTKIHSLQQKSTDQFVHNRPFEGVRSDFGSKELLGLTIDSRDLDIIEQIKKKEPMKSKRAKVRFK